MQNRKPALMKKGGIGRVLVVHFRQTAGSRKGKFRISVDFPAVWFI